MPSSLSGSQETPPERRVGFLLLGDVFMRYHSLHSLPLGVGDPALLPGGCQGGDCIPEDAVRRASTYRGQGSVWARS